MSDSYRQRHQGAGRWVAVAACLELLVSAAHAGNWKPLSNDGVHDPDAAALELLQDPADALSRLPSDSAGNRVDWVRALEDGYIKPRSTLHSRAPVRTLDSSILMNETGSIPRVRFPHKPHTQWLDCQNCHEEPFKSKPGATPVTMGKILEGEYCGMCHGAVAFPLTECNRCHAEPWPGSQEQAAPGR